MVEAPATAGYTVIVESIGTATPVVSNVLSEGLGIPKEIVLKALYNTPSVMFSKVDKETADAAVELLHRLGLETKLQSADEPVRDPAQTYDVGIYIHDASQLPLVCRQLGAFVGCTEPEALNLLIAEPCVVLGGVSKSTAEALAKRISAEVILSNPKEEYYTLHIDTGDEMARHQLQAYFRHHNMEVDLKTTNRVENLDYETTHNIWRKFQSTGMVGVVNQSFQRFEIILTGANTSNPAYRTALTENIGMPDDIVEDVLANLPVQLETGLNRADIAERVPNLRAAGLECKAVLLNTEKHYLLIEQMGNLEATRNALAQLYDTSHLPTAQKKWKSPAPMGDLLLRYTTNLLEQAGCEIDYEPAT